MGFLYLFDVDNTAVATGAESIKRREDLTTLLTGEGFAPDRVAAAIRKFDRPESRLISNA